MPYRNIDDPAKLRRLLEAVLLLEQDISLPVLLRHFIEEACSMVGARYGALGVLNEDHTALSEFITVGFDAQTEATIGPRPTGKGILGLLIEEPHAIRMANIADHPKRYGFPPNHPPMKSFLGVPVRARDEVFGNLYLTDKMGWNEFTKDDEELVQGLALAAGIAIENARLHQRVGQMAVFEDRDRIARDLHDAVVQQLFAIGLSLQGITRSMESPAVTERINRAIADIDDSIRQIRASIFELSSTSDIQGSRAAVLALVADLESTMDFEARVSFEGPVDSSLSPGVLEHLLFALHESLTNVAKHAQATEARVSVRVNARSCLLRVQDNGRGFSASASSSPDGIGLTNLRGRAEKLQGEMTIESSESGTTVEWSVPLLHDG